MAELPPGAALLVGPGLLALAALVAHAWRTRSPRTAIAFFAASFAFGVLRGNFIGWFMRDASAQLGLGGDGGLMPYVMRAPLLRIGYASLFECFGWMLALYLGWTLSEGVLRRWPRFERRLFPLLLLASVFTAALGYGVEAGANAMHWWTWTLPLKSRFLVELPPPGLWAWFSVAPDFLLPFLLILERPRPGLHWLSLLLFPVHMASNLLDLVAGRLGGSVLGEPSWLAHLAILAALVVLASRSEREVALPASPPAPATGAWAWLPVAGATFVLAVLWAAIGPLGGRWDLWAATGPLLVFILLATPAPLWVVALAAAACAPLAGGRGLAAAVPLLAAGVVVGARTAGRRRALAASVAGALVVALAWQSALERAERDYVRARLLGSDWPRALRRLERLSPSPTGLHLRAGSAFASAGDDERAADAFRAALRLEPDLAPARNGLGLSLLGLGEPAAAADELERATRLVPRAEGLHQNLGLAQLAAGRLDAARASFERARGLDPRDPRPVIGLSRVAMAAGRADEAIALLTQALGAGPGDGEIQLALGGIHQEAGRRAEAEQHFLRAIARGGRGVAAGAGVRLAVLLAEQPGRLPEAQRAAEAAVAAERSDVTLDTLGWVLIRARKLPEARAVLIQALEASQGAAARQRIEQHLAQAGGG